MKLGEIGAGSDMRYENIYAIYDLDTEFNIFTQQKIN